jgi:hypothetical protein
MTLSLRDEGAVGLRVQQKDRALFLGSAPAGALEGVPGEFHGLRLARGDEALHEINAASAERTARSGPPAQDQE